jgi:hypothetical protein
MNDRKSPAESESSRQRKKPVDEPEKLSPIPGAPESEEPQVDEVLTPEERRKYRRKQQARKPEPL